MSSPPTSRREFVAIAGLSAFGSALAIPTPVKALQFGTQSDDTNGDDPAGFLIPSELEGYIKSVYRSFTLSDSGMMQAMFGALMLAGGGGAEFDDSDAASKVMSELPELMIEGFAEDSAYTGESVEVSIGRLATNVSGWQSLL